MGKITIETNVAEEVLEKNVIRFFLQPLVENSVFHGLEGQMEDGFVDVDIINNGDRLEVTVKDNGCGMDEETLENLRDRINNSKESSGIGLTTVIQRLRLFYGDDYTVNIESKEDEGTVIFISVPDHIREP